MHIGTNASKMVIGPIKSELGQTLLLQSTGGAPTLDLCIHLWEPSIYLGGGEYLSSFAKYFPPYK